MSNIDINGSFVSDESDLETKVDSFFDQSGSDDDILEISLTDDDKNENENESEGKMFFFYKLRLNSNQTVLIRV